MLVETIVRRETVRRDKTLVGWPANSPLERSTSTEGGVRGYRLGDRIHDSGEIYEGHYPGISTPITIKLFRRSTGESSAAVNAFSTEAGRISIMRHPNIAQVVDSGIFADRIPFLALERLNGRTLDERISCMGPLALSEVYLVVRGVALALAAAHTAGVVHREIRPDNIFLVEGPNHEIETAKVLDFGVSQLTWGRHSTGQGVSREAARYLAPEQEQGGIEDVDASTDQFALATLAYQLLTNGASGGLTVGGRAWSAIEVVLLRALSTRQSDRFRSVGLFFHSFEEALLPQEVMVEVDGGSNDHVPRRRAPLVAVALILVTGVAGFGVRTLGWGDVRSWRAANLPLAAFLLGTKSGRADQPPWGTTASAESR